MRFKLDALTTLLRRVVSRAIDRKTVSRILLDLMFVEERLILLRTQLISIEPVIGGVDVGSSINMILNRMRPVIKLFKTLVDLS